MMTLKVKLCTMAASVLTVLALTDISIASLASYYQPEIPEELQ